jgi:hypothetical protein
MDRRSIFTQRAESNSVLGYKREVPGDNCDGARLLLIAHLLAKRVARQLAAHYGTIALVLGPTAVKLLMLSARVPLRIVLRLKEPRTFTH